MTNSFCTIFDKNYLFQGLALFQSLEEHAGDFRLYVLCMDEETHTVLSRVAPAEKLVPVREADLRAHFPELVEHATRTTRGQFIWSCQPFGIQFLLERFSLHGLTYLEADSAFFSDPAVLFAEIADRSASVVPHRYSPGFDQTAGSGVFCVQFNFFRADASAKSMLNSWKAACLQYHRDAPLNYPGQKDLDSWPARFSARLAVVAHLGAGVAPWNVQQFQLERRGSLPFVNGQPTVFYHYHELAWLATGGFDFGGYPLSREVVEAFYLPYLVRLRRAEQCVRAEFPTFSHRKIKTPLAGWRGLVDQWKRRVRGTYNVFPAV